MQNLFSVAGKVAIITGASSGMGCHFAKTLVDAGAKVVLGARRLDKIESIANEITKQNGFALPIQLDVTDPDSINEFAEKIDKDLGKADILINCAGLDIRKTFFDHELSDWERIFDTNLKGVCMVSQAIAKLMVNYNNGGSIINISSLLDVSTYKGGSPAYSASKAGVSHLTRILAVELGSSNIRVNAISPGIFNTEMTESLFSDGVITGLKDQLPLTRAPKLEDLDGALLLLASDASGYITGSVIRVDGGLGINKFSFH